MRFTGLFLGLISLITLTGVHPREVPFSPEIAVSVSAEEVSAIAAADIDGDGDLDLLSASFANDTIAWHQNTDGSGTFAPQRVISTSADGAQSVCAADIDRDGDLDVVSASFADNKIAWYENTDGDGTFGAQQVISTSAAGARSVFAADLNRDGNADIIAASAFDNTVAWYPNTGSGSFASPEIISTSAMWAEDVFAADVDGDGDEDVLVASDLDNEVVWHENLDGEGTFGPERLIAGVSEAKSVFAADIDRDGDVDVISAAQGSDAILWHENTSGTGSIWAQHLISNQPRAPQSVYAVDLDSDGDMDVLSASLADDVIAWCENTDGNGTFGAQRVISSSADGAMAVIAADIDGDGDPDVCSASLADDKIAWYDNETIHRSAIFPEQRVISTLSDDAASVVIADLDGDDDMDLLVGFQGEDSVSWFENINGAGQFGPRAVISTEVNSLRSVISADLDGDGDQDVLSASYADSKVAWYENIDGEGTFGPQRIISETMETVRKIIANDVDSDGDMDVLTASSSSSLQWIENLNGLGTFGEPRVIVPYSNLTQPIVAADVDGDGDSDFIYASRIYDFIYWMENIDGEGEFGNKTLVSNSEDGPSDIVAADMDGDGDMDLLVSLASDDSVVWYENMDGLGAFSTPREITTDLVYPKSVFAADVDGDGDLDALSTSSENLIAWFENTDGSGIFGPLQHISDQVDFPNQIIAADIDGDGDMDTLSVSLRDDKIAWYENTDGEGTFGPSQVVTNPRIAPVAMETSDIDGDGDFDVLAALSLENAIAWYENLDGMGDFNAELVISTQTDDPQSVRAADLDGDGDADVLSASSGDDTVAWFENMDGNGTFGDLQVITTSAEEAEAVCATDIDGDGDMDVLVASTGDNTVAWFENTDGDGSFGPQRLISDTATEANDVHAADLDGDGDIDVLAAIIGTTTLVWHENTDGLGTFGPQREIIQNFSLTPTDIFTADVDSDGDTDVLVALYYHSHIGWIENIDGAGTFGPVMRFSYQYYASSVYAADLDGNGNVDALSTSEREHRIVWHNNIDGAGGFEDPLLVSGDAMGAQVVRAEDIDGDGVMDVLSASLTDDKVSWYTNRGGQALLATADVAPAIMPGSAIRSVLLIDLTHRGIPGDSDVELASLDLLFEGADGQPLTSEEANAIIANLHIALDDGSGQLELDQDTLLRTVTDLDLTDGLLTLEAIDGHPDARVAHGAHRRFFIIVETTHDAVLQTPNQFRITHLSENGSVVEDAEHDIPLNLEHWEDTSTVLIEVTDPIIEASIQNVSFGEIGVDTGESDPKSVTITNTGWGPLTIHSAEIGGPDATHFRIVADTSETTLHRNETRTIEIVFDPALIGPRSTSLYVRSNSPGEQLTPVGLLGRGTGAVGPTGATTGQLVNSLLRSQRPHLPFAVRDVNADESFDAADVVSNVISAENQ